MKKVTKTGMTKSVIEMTTRNIMAIDPGNVESAYVIIDRDFHVLRKGKLENAEMRQIVSNGEYDELAIEMVASYGMPVGASVFETCVWIGRFFECAGNRPVKKVYRKDVKMNICGQTRAKDANIIQALIDRFAMNTSNRGKGTKKDPGFFYGFKADIWQAFALAVTFIDKEMILNW